MDINCLRTFLEVYRASHFGKAADSLFVTQSTVSARIRQLEDDLGVQLFKRDRNNIQLTPAGKKFLGYAEKIVSIWNKAKIDVKVIDEGKTSFVIGSVPNLWNIHMVNWLGKFKKKFPDYFISIETVSSEQLTRNLLEQTIDLGFSYEQPRSEGIVSHEYQTLDLIMITTYKNLDIKKAFQSNYYYIDWGNSYAREHERLFEQHIKPEIKINTGKNALDFIKNFGGTAYLPEPMVKDELLNNTLFMVKDAPEIKRKIYLIYNENNLDSEFVDTVLGLKKIKLVAKRKSRAT